MTPERPPAELGPGNVTNPFEEPRGKSEMPYYCRDFDSFHMELHRRFLREREVAVRALEHVPGTSELP